VGKLDDTLGDDNPRERFRLYLKENANEVGQIRDYIGESLRNTGSQYNRAFQDLINYLGHFLGFEVRFGRYQGVQGQIGFDGLWKSPSDFYIVVEVKTTEVYAIKTATLTNYIDEAISEKIIPDRDHVLGLYIVGRADPEVHQLENAIYAGKRMDQLRVISAESLLSLAELMNNYDVSHTDILAVLRPSGPVIDPIIDLMARLAAESEVGAEPNEPSASRTLETGSVIEKTSETREKPQVGYWLSPVIGNDKQAAEEVIQDLVGVQRIYAFGERTPGRKHLKPGDMICFYAEGNGVVGHATVSSYPEKKSSSAIRDPERYPWLFSLEKNRTYIDNPVIIDAALRAKLDAFKNRDPNKPWSWFVFSTRRLSENDFRILTRENSRLA
jgi:hypothetical protein